MSEHCISLVFDWYKEQPFHVHIMAPTLLDEPKVELDGAVLSLVGSVSQSEPACSGFLFRLPGELVRAVTGTHILKVKAEAPFVVQASFGDECRSYCAHPLRDNGTKGGQ